MVRFARWVALIVSLVVIADTYGSAASAVEIKLSGRYYAEPATVQMLITVEPSAENRTLRVEADGDNMFCSTEIALEGNREKRLHTIQFKNLSAGGYTIRAQVLSTSAVRSQATQQIVVAGSGQ